MRLSISAIITGLLMLLVAWTMGMKDIDRCELMWHLTPTDNIIAFLWNHPQCLDAHKRK